MKEVKCLYCGKGTGIVRHDNHILITLPVLMCLDCEKAGKHLKKNELEKN